MKTMKTLPAPMKLADAELGSVAGASGLCLPYFPSFDYKSVSLVQSGSNSGTQVALGNAGSTSQSMQQGNANGATIVVL